MNQSVDHDDLEAALRRCGSHWSGAQVHGLLCGRLAVRGGEGGGGWPEQVLESQDRSSAACAQCESLLDSLFQSTWQQLSERQSEFDLLLPEDSASAALRTRALADWCEGFLHGLVSRSRNEAVRKRLAEDPLSDLIRDMLEITRATVGDEDEDSTETAYSELVEYIRVAVQVAYEELADLRSTPLSASVIGGDSQTLH